MFAGEFAAGIRQNSGGYAETHSSKIIFPKSIHLSEETLTQLHVRYLCNVIFTVNG
jgi:hypothetical protein